MTQGYIFLRDPPLESVLTDSIKYCPCAKISTFPTKQLLKGTGMSFLFFPSLKFLCQAHKLLFEFNIILQCSSIHF